jgi:alpha-1,2-mannosyltransferase
VTLSPALRRVVAVLVVALGIAAVASRASSFGAADLVRNEFTQDYVSARALSARLDPYAPAPVLMRRFLPGRQAYVVRNPHTPIQILLVWPISHLPYRGARAIWLLIQAAAIALGVGLVTRELGWSAGRAVVVGIGALAVPVAQKELIYGNLNGVILLLLAMAWRDLRRSSDRRAGVALGAAAALRLFPIFMLIPVLRMRRVKTVASTVATAAALTVVGFVPFGVSALHGFRASLAENASFWRAAPFNVSLIAIPYRWLSTTIWHRGVANAPTLATILAVMLALACVVGASRTRATQTYDRFWAAVPWMILASPLAWDWYLVIAIPAVVVMVGYALEEHEPPSILALLAVAFIAIGIPPGLPIPGQPISLAALVIGYGLATYGLVLLGVADATRPAVRVPDMSPA